MENKVDVSISETTIDKLYLNTVDLIQYARSLAVKQVNFIQLMTYYSIGRWIVEEQQEGNSRAKYGQQIIKNLSEKLLNEFGRGFSGDTLKNARKFYLIYKDRISETVFSLFAIEKSETVFSLLNEDTPFQLSWSHYLQLMRIENAEERNFYEIEAVKSNWSVRTL